MTRREKNAKAVVYALLFAMLPLLQVSPEVYHPVKRRSVADFVTDAHRKGAVIYKDHVARSI